MRSGASPVDGAGDAILVERRDGLVSDNRPRKRCTSADRLKDVREMVVVLKFVLFQGAGGDERFTAWSSLRPFACRRPWTRGT